MSDHKHLWLVLTAHGFGHAAMSAPVVRLLKKMDPELRVTVQSGGLPLDFLQDRLGQQFETVCGTPDFGLVMESATSVNAEKTAMAYQCLHQNLTREIDAETERLLAAQPDLVLSNVSYVAVAAAARAGIPAVALCCLNWADLYWHYCSMYPDAKKIHREMLECYHQADLFLRPLPAMPMPDLHTRVIGPIAMLGSDRKKEMRCRLSLSEETRVGILAFGGVAMSFGLERLPYLPGWHWLSDDDQAIASRSDMSSWQELDIPLVDIIHSCDLIISKPGYNTFSEAGVNGTPLLWIERPGWPENTYLDQWLKQNGKCEKITAEKLFDPQSLAKVIDTLFRLQTPAAALPTGTQEAAEILWELLRKGHSSCPASCFT